MKAKKGVFKMSCVWVIQAGDLISTACYISQVLCGVQKRKEATERSVPCHVCILIRVCACETSVLKIH